MSSSPSASPTPPPPPPPPLQRPSLSPARNIFDTLFPHITRLFRLVETLNSHERQSRELLAPSPSSSPQTRESRESNPRREIASLAKTLHSDIVAEISNLRYEYDEYTASGWISEAETVSVWLGEYVKWEPWLEDVVEEYGYDDELLLRG